MAPAPMPTTTRNPFSEGGGTPPNGVVVRAGTTPAAAPDTAVPMDRVSVLRLLAATVAETRYRYRVSAA
ncbi:hypothetical protein G3I56_26865 [Streptomyces sp. SID12488]|nr:hypothetical protein [Streptomyces sp. SID12488]